MQLGFTIQDYVVLTITLVSTILGLFIGFSGAVAFFCGLASAAVAAKMGWAFSADYFSADWSRALVTLVITLLAFGLVRVIIRKFVHVLLAQPADAIFGAIAALISGASVSLAFLWILTYFGILPSDSILLTEVMSLVG